MNYTVFAVVMLFSIGGAIVGWRRSTANIENPPEKYDFPGGMTRREHLRILARKHVALTEFVSSFHSKKPAVILDEFDLIKSPDEQAMFANFVKQIADKRVNIRFFFCGIAAAATQLFTLVGLVSLVSFFTPTAVLGWGATGHEWVFGITVEKLPDSLSSFTRTPEAIAEIAIMGRELDRSEGSGKTHDAERDPGHYGNLADDRSVEGVLPLEKLAACSDANGPALRPKVEAGLLTG